MQRVLSYLLPPLIGALIGYITNDIAIKMLFRPYEPIMLGRFRLPFTPGIVPRRLKDLALLLGREVEARFFNADDLEILFSSDEFAHAVAENLTDALYDVRTSLCLTMEKLEASEEYGGAIRTAKAELAARIAQAAAGYDYAPLIVSAAQSIAEKRGSGGKNLLISMAPTLSDAIRQYFADSGSETLAPVIEEFLVDFGDRPVNRILTESVPDKALLTAAFQALWLRFMAHSVRPVVESIDVGGMITDKLRDMRPRDVEALVLSVVRREFRYVVWLGALLGAVIGTVNIFI